MTTSNLDRELNGLFQRANLKFPDTAKEDLLNVLNNFKDLQPDVVNFKFPDMGMNRHCFSLSGTVPIHYKGGKYNIPVAIYFLDNHPFSGPYCYVKPTTCMRIRQSKTVDATGRIYLPYLTEWQYPSHDTPGLIQVMILSFQDKCPVYSVGPTAASTVTANNNSCSNINRSSSTPPGITSGAPPPFPTATNPVPPYPTPNANPPYPSSNPPYPTVDPPSHLMPQPNVLGSAGYPPPAHYQTPYPSDPTPAIPTVSHQPMQQLGSGYGYSTSTIQPTHIRASLLSAVEDRIKQKLCDKLETPFAELESIDANLRELQSGKQTLKEMMENINRDQAELDRILAIYKSKKEEQERALQAANSHGTANGTVLDVEDAIDPQTPVHQQILRCYVQDCAVDDTIYSLGQSLKRGTLNLQTYLKFVRQLSHQQFQHRYLMQKCRERARLPI